MSEAEPEPTRKDKGKGKAVESQNDANAQTDGPTDHNSDCPQGDSTIDECMTDESLSPGVSRFVDQSQHGSHSSYGSHWSPQAKHKFIAKQNFVVNHWPKETSTSDQSDPSPQTESSTAAARAAARGISVIRNTVEMQNTVRAALGIDRIPSPTVRPTKSLFDLAVGYLYSTKRRLRPEEEREEDEDDVLD